MDTGIIVALITGAFTFAGVLITQIAGNKKTSEQVKAQAEMTRYRIDQLEKKQDKHNTLIERMYNVEERVGVLEQRVTLLHSNDN